MSDEKRPPPNPSGRGGFVKGRSGNPGGRAKELVKEIRERFKGDVPQIFETFRDLAIGLSPEGYLDIKTSDRIKAGQEVLDRVLGKSVQAIEGEMNIGISPEQAAVLAAIQLTPHERRQREAVLAAEDKAAIEAFEAEHDPGQD